MFVKRHPTSVARSYPGAARPPHSGPAGPLVAPEVNSGFGGSQEGFVLPFRAAVSQPVGRGPWASQAKGVRLNAPNPQSAETDDSASTNLVAGQSWGGSPLPPAGTMPPTERNKMLLVTAKIVMDGTISEGAEGRLNESIQKFADELCKRVRETEKRERAAGQDVPEYTASNVIKANDRLTREAGDHRPSFVDILLRVTAPVFSGAAGIMGSYLNSVFQAGLFGAVAAIAFFTTLILVFRTR